MSKLLRLIGVSVLVVWGLAASHCELEHLSGWEWLGCGPAAGSGPHQSADCEGDACSVIESGLYRMEDQAGPVLPPVLNLAFLLPADPVIVPPSAFRHARPVAAPPELACAWQFALRAALAPRAPNFFA